MSPGSLAVVVVVACVCNFFTLSLTKKSGQGMKRRWQMRLGIATSRILAAVSMCAAGIASSVTAAAVST